MYKNKLFKYQKKLKQYGGLSCPYKINDRVVVTNSDNIELLYKIGIITKIHYNVPEGAYYFNPICNKVNINIDGNIHSVSTLNIKKFTDLTPKLILSIKIDSIPLDTIIEIFKNLKYYELIDIYNSTDRIQLKEAINKYPFNFYEYSVPANMTLKEFRDIFCNAIGINISYNTNIINIDFTTNILPRNLYNKFSNTRQLKVNISGCTQLTDSAFIPLKNYIHTLNMRECNQETITDAAFVNLNGIHTLEMPFCDQKTITNAAFKHLVGVHTLNIKMCNQETITDSAFVNLKSVRELDMKGCNQRTITDAAFKHLAGVKILNMSLCNQDTINGNEFCRLNTLTYLDVNGCNKTTLDAAERIFGITSDNQQVKYFKNC